MIRSRRRKPFENESDNGYRRLEPSRRSLSVSSTRISIDGSLLKHNDFTSSQPTGSNRVSGSSHNQEEIIITVKDLTTHEYKTINLKKYHATIDDLKNEILKLWSLHNVTTDQLELYVRDSKSRQQRSIKDIPVNTRLRVIWDDNFLYVSFVSTSKQNLPTRSDKSSKSESVDEELEKPKKTAEESCCAPAGNNSTRSSRATSDLEKVPKGLCVLENIGNTCFMNSALQCLSNIPPLSRFFIYNRILKLINAKNPAGTGGRIALTYSSLVQEMWSGKIEKCIPTALKQTIDLYTTQFTENDQHDSQEFMGFLLDALHEDLLYTHTESSPIAELFQGQLETTVHCENDCPPVLTLSTFNFLPLPIPLTKYKTHLSECMQSFLETETIGSHGKWYCDSCHQKTNALKSTNIKLLPPVLILQLKRFQTFTTSGKQRVNSNKIQTLVDYPINNLNPQDLAPRLISAATYDLVAVSVHRGTSSTSGHYTTIAKNRKNNLWYHFNDSIVTLASEEEVQTKNAYILCYVRKGMNELPIKVYN